MAIALVLGVRQHMEWEDTDVKGGNVFPSYISDFTDASSIPDIDPNVSDFQ